MVSPEDSQSSHRVGASSSCWPRTAGFQSAYRGSNPLVPIFEIMVASANWSRLPELHSGLCGFDSHRNYYMCSASVKTGRGAPLRMTVARP